MHRGTPDIRDFRASFELGGHAIERGDPGGGEVGDVAGPEEPLGSFEEARVVLMPAEAAACAHDLGEPVDVVGDGERQLERAGDGHAVMA
jgi:hypothetical protein